jgi:secreted trypsin-like serine protease
MKLFYFILSIFIFSVLTACQVSENTSISNAQSQFNPFIINGREVSKSDLFARHVVGIFKKGETKCTGVLISKNAVLTAAHCLSDIKNASISFGLNKKNLKLLPIAGHLQHPQYDESIIGIVEDPANDVMVVAFSGDLPAGYEPAQISDQDLVQKGSVVLIAGYGRDEDDQYDYLKATEVNVVEAVSFEFRTEEKKSGSCDGDSGGPVFLKNSENKYLLVGSVSRGDPSCYQYGIYENMTFYKEWIHDAVEILTLNK